jgi:hypothetical protein
MAEDPPTDDRENAEADEDGASAPVPEKVCLFCVRFFLIFFFFFPFESDLVSPGKRTL